MGMEPFVGASAGTFSPLVASIPDPVKNMRDAIAFKIGLAQKQAEIGQANAQAQEVASKLERQQQFQADVAKVGENPDAGSISSLITKYPEFADKLKTGWDVKDEAAKSADLTHLGEVYSAAASGQWDLAAKQAQARIDADKAAGHADPSDDAMLEQINAAATGDERAKKQVLTLLGTHLAAVAGPDHFASVYGALKGGYTLEAGATRYDDNGNEVARSPYLRAADGGILERDSASSGAAAGDAPAAQGGFDFAVSNVLKHEGGYNPADMNGSPTMRGINWKANAGKLAAMGYTPSTFKNLTEDQAKQIYRSYWDESGAEKLPPNMQAPYFDVYIRNPKAAKSMAAKAGSDPVAFMEQAQGYFGKLAQSANGSKYAKAWSNRDAENMALARSGAPADGSPAATNAPPGYHVLVPGKPKEAPSGFRWNAQGNLEAIPGGPADQNEDGMDPQAIEFSAQQYLTTGQMPTLGMGKAAATARKQIIERAAKIAGADGLTGADFARQMTHYKAATQAIKTLETQAGTIEANEQTALANGQQFLDRSRELTGNSNFPAINSITQFVKRHTGDTTVRAMDAAWNTFVTEYAKVVAGSPSGAGTLSDSARHEAMEIMKTSDSLPQKQAVFKQMQADMANRMAAIHGTIASKYDQLTTNPRKAADIAQQTDLSGLKANKPAATVRIRTAAEWSKLKPGTRYIDPNGVQRVKH